MKKIDLTKMTKEDLGKKIDEERTSLHQVLYDIRLGKEKNVRKGLMIRKNIARMLTVLKTLK